MTTPDMEAPPAPRRRAGRPPRRAPGSVENAPFMAPQDDPADGEGASLEDFDQVDMPDPDEPSSELAPAPRSRPSPRRSPPPPSVGNMERNHAFQKRLAFDDELAALLSKFGVAGVDHEMLVTRRREEYDAQHRRIRKGHLKTYSNETPTPEDILKDFGGGEFTITFRWKDPNGDNPEEWQSRAFPLEIAAMPKHAPWDLEKMQMEDERRHSLAAQSPDAATANVVAQVVEATRTQTEMLAQELKLARQENTTLTTKFLDAALQPKNDPVIELVKAQTSQLNKELVQVREEANNMMTKVVEVLTAPRDNSAVEMMRLQLEQMKLEMDRKREEDRQERRDREEKERKEREERDRRDREDRDRKDREEERRRIEEDRRRAEERAAKEAEERRREEERREQRERDKELFQLQMKSMEKSSETVVQMLTAQLQEVKNRKSGGMAESIQELAVLKESLDMLSGKSDKPEPVSVGTSIERIADKAFGFMAPILQNVTSAPAPRANPTPRPQQPAPPAGAPAMLPPGTRAVAVLDDPPAARAEQEQVRVEEEQKAIQALPKNELTDFIYPVEGTELPDAIRMLVKDLDLGISRGFSISSIREQVIDKFPPTVINMLKAVGVDQIMEIIDKEVPETWAIRQIAGRAIVKQIHSLVRSA